MMMIKARCEVILNERVK